LRKAKDVIGLPVISIDSGKQVGQVKDLWFEPDWKLSDVVLEAKGWFAPGRAIRSADIIGVGDAAVTIANESAAGKQREQTKARPLFEGDGKLLGMPIVTIDGDRLGVVEDVYFEPNLGKQIVSFELSEGFLSDLQEGRKWLPVPEAAKLGEDAIVVPAHCKEEVQELFVSHE
jgi:uncharacterized protein YrrD